MSLQGLNRGMLLRHIVMCFVFLTVSVLDVLLPSLVHGMTNKGRGPAVPPVGVRQLLRV